MTVDEYVDFSIQVIKSNLNPESGYITAARLGLLLRRSDQGVSWKDFGFNSLASFLRVVEQRGQVSTVSSEKGALAVRLADQPFRLQPPPKAPTAYNPLRKPIWVAFVLDAPSGRRFLHRATGQVRLGIQRPPAPADEWAEIKPVAPEEQRELAREFIRAKSINLEGIEDSIQAVEWYKDFPDALRGIDAELVREWNQLRSAKISEAVAAWSSANSVPSDVVFQSGFGTARAALKSRIEKANTIDTDDSRNIVLAALSHLPTDALLDIPIPAKYILRALGRDGRPTNV